MNAVLRALRLLSVVVWVGGIVFFAFVLAPVAFSLLPSQHIAGTVVGGTLRVLDIVGLVCGLMFWLSTFVLSRHSKPRFPRGQQIQLLLAAFMLLATAYLHEGILPEIERARVQAGGDIEAAPVTDPAKQRFEALHKRSESVEGAVLLLGLGVVVLLAQETAPLSQ
jgi:hypothetical protein